MEKETRKLIKQGGGGFTVYLPKKWADKKGLKAGDHITVQEVDSSLVIDTASKEKREVVLEVKKENHGDIKNILTHIYRAGYNKIIIRNPHGVLKEIKDVTRDLLLGFEVTDITHELCAVENISEPSDEKYDVMLRRVFLIIQEMIDIIRKDFEKGEFDSFEEITDLRKQEDKLILFCRRLLRKGSYNKNILLSWELLTFLMHIGHAAYYLYSYSYDNKVKKDKEILEMLKDLSGYFGLYYRGYYDRDLDAIHRIDSLKGRYHFGGCLRLIEKSSGKRAVVFSYIKDIFRLIHIGRSPILTMILGY